MNPRFETLREKKLLGNRLLMSLANNRTAGLWKNFMQKRKQIMNAVTNDLISLQVYDPSYFADFHPSKEFEKWATIEVADFDHVPYEMETFTLKGGLYAVFQYRGLAGDNRIFQYIFEKWLPASGYELDDRPHFEILGEKYNNTDPYSEEEIWIPVKQKS